MALDVLGPDAIEVDGVMSQPSDPMPCERKCSGVFAPIAFSTRKSFWKKFLKNDFENYAFSKVKILKKIKDHLTKVGAKYVSLSGSGSCLYGIFNIEDLDETEINFSYYSVKALA